MLRAGVIKPTAFAAARKATKGMNSMIKLRNAFLAVATISSIGAMPSTGFAFKATAEQRAACMGDAMKLCASYGPDEFRVATCLLSKKSQLSPPCLAVVNKAQH
jgi:hypothetical protein